MTVIASAAAIDMTAPPTNAGRALVRKLVLGYLAAAVVLAALVLLASRPLWWRGYLAASIVSAIAAAASVAPLLWGLRQNLDRLVIATFAAAGVRAVISLGAALWAVFFGGYPAAPTLLMMVGYYFVLLAVETSVIARSTWTSKG